MTVTLRKAFEHELAPLWAAIYTNLEWKKFDAPYFPFTTPTLAEFEQGLFARLLQGVDCKLIDVAGKPCGVVSFYWEYDATRWLETGIFIYDPSQWNAGIGRKALQLWISELFQSRKVGRIGLTTWSGNPRMVRCAEALGFSLEGCLRRCRYYNGIYYDSIRMGVLREEWFVQR
ncbi:MAG: GNAT family protein [Proteobacteria bacterium]|nr:GNAT family protein [Pseudomonadota bacterium]